MTIIAGQELRLHFRERVEAVCARRAVEMDPEVEFYLVDLLTRFAASRPAEAPEGAFAVGDRPLAFILKDALEAPPDRRVRLFRHLGDLALYVAGCFQDSLNRSLVDVEYYISMGEGAYARVGTTLGGLRNASGAAEVFADLSRRFAEWVDVLDEISEGMRPGDNRDILRLYERYLRTGSERRRERLVAEGLVPVTSVKPEFVQ